MIKKIIFFSGKSACGKDTGANMLKEILEKNNKKVLITHFADPVKHWAKDAYGWNGVKDKYGRALLQMIGTEYLRASFPDYWCEFIAKFVKATEDDWDYIIIPDLRFANEWEIFLNYFDRNQLVKVLIERVNDIGEKVINENMTQQQLEHTSENSFQSIDFDYNFTHNNLNNFKLQMETLYDRL